MEAGEIASTFYVSAAHDRKVTPPPRPERENRARGTINPGCAAP